MEKKYEITENGRIRALKDFADVKKGDIGGFIASENNLSQDGDCWVYYGAQVYNNARVTGNAKVMDYASVNDNAIVSMNAIIRGYGFVKGNSTVTGNAVVGGSAYISGNAIIRDNARIETYASIKGNAVVEGDALILDYCCLCATDKIDGCRQFKSFIFNWGADLHPYTFTWIKDTNKINLCDVQFDVKTVTAEDLLYHAFYLGEDRETATFELAYTLNKIRKAIAIDEIMNQSNDKIRDIKKQFNEYQLDVIDKYVNQNKS